MLWAGALLYLRRVVFGMGAPLFHGDKDFWSGVVTVASFGAAVATRGAAAGLHASAGAAGVGRATTTAVVLGCMAILVLDAFWALVLL
jgi:phospholipid/cholesterol/gamma-HCH transport system permease protein